ERKLVGVDINSILITSKKDAWLEASNDNQPKPGVFARNSRLKDANWIANTTRGTNDYMHCSHLIYLYDQNINPVVARWLGDSSTAFNDAYALTELIQWVWRSRVRRGEPITLYLPSPRMRKLFEEWLYITKTKKNKQQPTLEPSFENGYLRKVMGVSLLAHGTLLPSDRSYSV
ncbi:MAG: hypothetical protein O2936_15300, partial [Proteobacteria bacterium]|nr:hypothetical protein [Pseudomonadota bacterium]